jgi:CBS domain-containing protein
MRKDIQRIAHTASVRDAAKQMRDGRIGSVFVERNGSLIGIVTDTDVVRRGVADGADLNKMTVELIMTSPIVMIEAVRNAQDAHDLMADKGVRHLGVSEQGKLVGVVSVRDLLVHYKRFTEPKIGQD